MKMRILTLACAMILCLTGAAFAAPLAISQTRVDFGSLTEGPVVNQTVTLTNTAREMVTITNVTTS